MDEAPSTEQIRRLAGKHLELYTARITKAQKGAKYINVLQTARYLELWGSIVRKNYVWDQLTEAEQNEVLDAVTAGE